MKKKKCSKVLNAFEVNKREIISEAEEIMNEIINIGYLCTSPAWNASLRLLQTNK